MKLILGNDMEQQNMDFISIAKTLQSEDRYLEILKQSVNCQQ